MVRVVVAFADQHLFFRRDFGIRLSDEEQWSVLRDRIVVKIILRISEDQTSLFQCMHNCITVPVGVQTAD